MASDEQGQIKQIIKILNDDGVKTVKEISDELELNPMYVSGFLSALDVLDIVEKNEVGGSHVYLSKEGSFESIEQIKG